MDEMSRKTQKHVETQVRENVRKTSWHAKDGLSIKNNVERLKKPKAN